MLNMVKVTKRKVNFDANCRSWKDIPAEPQTKNIDL